MRDQMEVSLPDAEHIVTVHGGTVPNQECSAVHSVAENCIRLLATQCTKIPAAGIINSRISTLSSEQAGTYKTLDLTTHHNSKAKGL